MLLPEEEHHMENEDEDNETGNDDEMERTRMKIMKRIENKKWMRVVTLNIKHSSINFAVA